MVPRPVRILVADDEKTVRDLLRDVLGVNPRYEVLTARDGYEAIRMARREHPNLVLLDIWMPGATGLEGVEKRRTDLRRQDHHGHSFRAGVRQGDSEGGGSRWVRYQAVQTCGS